MPDGIADETSRNYGSVRTNDPQTEGQNRPARISKALGPRNETFTEQALPQHAPASTDHLVSSLTLLSKGREARSRRATWIGFLLCVVLPTAIVAAYFYFIAVNQYTAEFRFSVTETTPSLPSTSASTAAVSTASSAAAAVTPLIGNLTGTMGSSNSSTQNYVVIDYLISQQAVDDLEKRIKIKEMYSGAETKLDWWAAFESDQPLDRFLIYWKRIVTAQFDPMMGIATVKVRAFTPEQALLIGNTMVVLAEDLVNEIAMRPMRDAIRYAENEVKRSAARLEQVRKALAQYRDSTQVVDPTGSIANNVALLQALRSQLAQMEIEYRAASRQHQNPNAILLKPMAERIAAAREEVKKAEAEISKGRDGSPAIAEVTAKYEQLDLERQYATGMFVSTMQALDQARANAAAQHFYLTPYVRPSLPVASSYPKRFQSVALASLAFLAFWIVGVMVMRSVKEHL